MKTNENFTPGEILSAYLDRELAKLPKDESPNLNEHMELRRALGTLRRYEDERPELEASRAELLEALRAIVDCSAQHYAPSVYPGECAMVPVHNSNAGQHWVSVEMFTALQQIARAVIARAMGGRGE